MTESVDLDRIAAEVRVVAKECGALVVEVALSLETNSVPVAAVAASEFCGLVRHIRPRLIYLVVASFDAGDDTEAALGTDEESPHDSSHIKEFVSRWRYRDGQTSRVALGVMGDGVLHGLIEDADWISDFDSEIEALQEELAQFRAEREQKSREDGERKLAAEQRKRLAPFIKQLIADPRFSGPKVGIAKRTVLAEALFTELDRDTIRAIVERAENDHWLEGSR